MECVYKILNLQNGKFYIGSTKNFEKRCKEHKTQLKGNYHCNIKLQRAWNKYGENNFNFIILEECLNYKEREDYYLSLYNIQNETYNICEDSKSTWYVDKHPNCEIIKENISKSLSEYMNSLTKEERSIKYGRLKENHHNYKGGIVGNCIDCNKEIYYKSKRCRDCYIKNDSGNQKNRQQSKEEIKKRSESLKELYKNGYNPTGKIIQIDNIIYKSILQASKELNISYNTIVKRLKSLDYNNYIIINKCATTISKESTLQVDGNGNGRHPNKDEDIV